jgi:hypothetical protein
MYDKRRRRRRRMRSAREEARRRDGAVLLMPKARPAGPRHTRHQVKTPADTRARSHQVGGREVQGSGPQR